MATTDQIPVEVQVDKGLKSGALGLVSSVVIGVASTAPAYSLAATLLFVVVLVGVRFLSFRSMRRESAPALLRIVLLAERRKILHFSECNFSLACSSA